jgi:biopolymer transport protein ExbD
MKNKYLIFFIFLSVIILSCSKKDIQLPLIEADALSDIYNHSSIWIFYKKDAKDTLAVLNKNNKIINTHWILNIDKRLTMKHVTPVLIELQKAKHKPSMHKKEGSNMYFSYANTKSNKISLLEFNPINFQYLKELKLDSTSGTQVIKVYLKKNKILVNKTSSNSNHLKSILENYKKPDSLQSAKIYLGYDENISYQKYLQSKMILSKTNIAIDSTENIYSLK